MVALRSQGNWRWEGPLGTPLGLVHWKRASQTGTQVAEEAAVVPDGDTDEAVVYEQDQSGSDTSQLVVEEAQPEPAVEKAGLVKPIVTKIKALFSK